MSGYDDDAPFEAPDPRDVPSRAFNDLADALRSAIEGYEGGTITAALAHVLIEHALYCIVMGTRFYDEEGNKI